MSEPTRSFPVMRLPQGASDDDVLAMLRDRLGQLRRDAEARGLFVERNAPADWHQPLDGRYSIELYRQLGQANALVGETLNVPFLGVPSKLPLVGALIDALKRPVHELVRVYLHQLVRQQVAHEHRLLRVINEIVDRTEPDAADTAAALAVRVAALEQEVAQLRAAQKDSGR